MNESIQPRRPPPQSAPRRWNLETRMTIVLWDIDGTLIRSGGAGKLAMESALRSTFGLIR